MSDLDKQLRQLVEDACKHPPASLERQRCLTQIIRLTSGKLWREPVPYYQDALQQTWIYFCQHVCEKGTGERYDPSRSSVITWLNYYLRRRLQDGFIQVQKQQAKTAPTQTRVSASSGPDEQVNPVDLLPASPDVPPILDEVSTWAETDSSGELRRIHIEGYPQINCQLLILRRLPPETSWKALSEEFGVAVPTLSSFYQRQCLPRLRKFGESQGYI
ncbi:MAG: sigma-70 family RNA polymerase sigma factor [Kovacikia sp.]